MIWVRSLLVIVSVLLLIGGSGIFQYSLTASFTMSHDPSCIYTTSTSDSSALRCVTSPGNCHPWIQASVMEPVLFTGVRLAAEGLSKDLDALKAFKISYSHDALTWKYLKPKTLKKKIKKDTRGKSAAAAGGAPMFTIPCHFTAKHLRVDLLAESKSNRTCLHFNLVEQNAVAVMPESGGETFIFTALYQPSSINTNNTRKPHTRASTHHLSIGRTLLQISELSLVLSCTSGCGGDWSEPVTLTVTCINCGGLGSVSYTWDIQIVQLEDLPREVWEDRAVFSSDNTTLTLPGRFFNPFESYVVSVSGTSSVTEGGVNYTIPAKEHTLYITSSINTTSASVDSRVTFLVLLNSSDSDVLIEFGEYDSCIPNLATVSNTTRRTYPLSMFLLSNYTKGLKYAVFDFQFHTDGNFIISATTTGFPSSSSEVSVSVVYEKMEVGMCTNNTHMINASTSFQNAEIWGLLEDLYFKTSGGDACPSLTESYSWSLQRYTAGSTSKCTLEEDFEALDLYANTTHNQVLSIPSGHLSDGHYKLCLALDKHNNSVLLGTRTVCGFIQLQDDDYDDIQDHISCTHECPGGCTESVSLTALCTDCQGNYSWNIQKIGYGLLPQQVWENRAVSFSNNATLTLPGDFFNPFESYSINVSGSYFWFTVEAVCFISSNDNKVYITSDSNTTSVPVDSYITFLLLVNDSSSSVSVDIGGQDSCIPSLQTLTPSVRSSYPLSTFLLSSSTEGLTYALFGTHLGRGGNFIINASTTSPTPSQSLTSLDVVYEKIDVGQCTNDTIVNGTSRSIQAAPVYFRSRDLYFSLYTTVSCVLTSQNYHWTVVSYKEEDTSMCYREEDFESVTLAAGSGNSEVLHISAGALPQGYYRVGVTFEKHDSNSSVGSRTLYGFLQVVNEPLVVVMSPSVTHLAHDRNLPLVLNASASYNPNVGLPTTIRYSWYCQIDGQPCDCVPKMWPGVGNDTQIIPFTEPVLRMEGRYLTAGQNYSFTMTLDSDNVTGGNHTVLVAVSGVVSMQLQINCTSGCGDDSTEPVTLTVACTDCDGLGSVTYTWDIHKGQVGVLPPQMWEGHAVLNSDKTTLNLPGHFFNPFELYNISITALTNASSEGSAVHMMPVREDQVYITSDSNTTSVPVDSYITFLLLVNDSSSSMSVDIGGQDSCIPSLHTLTPSVRSSYPLSTFLLSSSTEGLTYALFGTHLGRGGNFIINASTTSPTPSQSLTSLDVVYEKIDVGQCTNDTIVNGTYRSIQAAPVYFRSRDLYFSLYTTVSCVLTSQNYHWTVVSYKEEDTSMCYREEDFESVTLAAGSGNSEVLHISAGALPQGYYRVGMTFEKHDSNSSVGSRTLYGFLQVVNEPLVVVMSPSVTHLAHDRNLPLVLNASASYNPNVGLPTTIRYSWYCQIDGQPCDCVPKMWPGVGNDTQIIPFTEPVLRMEGRYLTAGQNYSFTMTLDSDNVTGGNHTVLVAVSGVVSMQLQINCTSGCGDDSTEPVTLTVACTDCDGLGSVTYTWDIHKGQVGVLPPQMWEGHAVLNSDKTTLNLPGHFFNPFELYNISITALTNASSEGSAVHMMPVREDQVYITSDSNTTSVPVDSYITFLLLVNDSSSSMSVDIGGQDSCIPSLHTLTPSVRSSYPLSTFLLSSSTEGLTYALFGTHLGRGGNFIINASTTSPTPSQSLTSLDVVYEKIDVGQCTNDTIVNGTSRSIQAAPVYFRSRDLYFSLYTTVSCVLTSQNYHWTVVSYKEEDTSMCYREEDFESVTLAAGSGNSEVLHISAGALPQGYYRVGMTFEKHDSNSSVGSRTLYGFLQVVNEPLVVVMSPSVTHLAHDRNLPLVLNASASYNPNVGLPTTIRYSWYCQIDGQPCDCVPKMWPGVGNDTQIIPFTEPVLRMEGRYLTAGQNYSFTMTLDSDNVTGGNHTVLVAVSGVVSMQLQINCTSGCGDDSTEPVTLTVACTDCDGLGSVTYTWDIHKGQVGVLPPQMWEGHAVLNSDKTTLTLPGHFFNPFELYNISVTALTNASSEGSAVHMMPVREDKVYITSDSNTTSVPVDSYITFLLLVNDSSSSVSVDIGGQDSCIPSLQTLTPSVRSSYPLSTFLLSSSTEGLTYALFGTHLGRGGNFIINASTTSPTPSQSLTSLDVVYEKIDVGQCTNDTIVNGTSRSIQAAPVYFRSRDLYFSLYSTVSCVLTSQNYHWTVVSYKEEDTSMCYREEDFESVTLAAGSGNSEVLHISAGALPQGYYRVGMTFEKHDSNSSVGSRTLYGFLQVVNEPLVVVMSPSVSHLAHDRNLPLVLNASASYNPNVGLPTTIRYSWYCQIDGQPCDCVPKMWPGVGNDTQIIPFTEPVLRMEGRYLTAGQNYSFTMTLDSDNVTGGNHTVLVAVSGVVSMQLQINCTSGCGDDSTEPVTLTVACTDCDGLGSVTYTWDIHKGQVGVLPPQMWEGHAVLNSDKTTLTLPGHFFNPFELYNISITALTNASSEGSAVHMMPVREDKVYITSDSNTTSVPVDSYITFLLLVNDSSSSVSVDIGGQDSCIPSLQTLTPSVRSSYPLSTFLLSSSTEGLTYALFGTHLGRGGNFIINASTTSPTPSQSLTSLDVVYEKIDVGQCTNDTIVNGTSRSIQAAPVYFRSRDLYFSLYTTVSCVLTSQNYHWTVVSYKEEDTSMCYREEDFESVTLAAGSGNSEVLHISAGALPQGYYRVGVTFEKHDSHSSVGSRTLYGFLQVVNEPLVVVMSPSVTHLAHDRNLPLVLNASASYNPNVGLPTTIRYSWYCQIDGQPCDCVPKMWPGVGNDTQIIPLTEPVLRMEGRYLTAGQNYSFTMTLDSDNVTGGNHTVLVAVSGVVSMQLEINCTSGCGDDSTEPVTLTVACTDCDGLGSVTYTWDIHKGQVGVLPPQMWEGHAVLNSDKTTLTLPGHFFNPFELYNISITALTNASSEGSAVHMMPVREDKVYITSNSNTTSVPVDSYITFLLLVNDSSSSVSVDIGGQDSCIPSLQTLTPSVRSSYPLSTFLLSSSTEGLTYALFGTHLGSGGNFIINASTTSPTPSQSLTSLDVVYEKIDVGQCTNDTIVNGTSRSIQAAPVYFRSRDLYFSLYTTVSCVLTSQNYHWTVVSYKEEDTSMCYREEDFESVTLAAGSGNSEVLHISAGALPQGYYRVGVTFEKHDSNSSVGSRTLYGFLQVVNEPLVVVMSPSVTHLAHDRNLPLVLNASASYNPNVGLPTTIRYSWHCQMDGQPCDCVLKMWPGVGNDTQIIPFTEPVLTIEGRHLTAGQNYSFTMTLDSDNVTGSNHTVLVAVSGVVSLHFNISCESGCGGIFEPSETLSFKVSCLDCFGTVTYSWRVERNGMEGLPVTSWAPNAVVGSDGSLTVPPGTLMPWESYNFIVRGTINPSGEASYTIGFQDYHVFLLPQNISVSTGSLLLFLVLSSSSNEVVIQLAIDTTYLCTSSMSVVTPAGRATYPLSFFNLTDQTDSQTYQVISQQFTVPGVYIISAYTNVGDETFSSTLTVTVQNAHSCSMSVEILGVGDSLLTATEYTLGHDIHFTSTYSSVCEEMTILSYNWTVSQDLISDPHRCRFEDDFQEVTLPVTSAVVLSESFHIGKKILPLGYNRLCLVIVFRTGSVEYQSQACGYLKMLTEPLVTSLSPSASFLTLPRNRPLVLNASTSYNPNSDDQSNISFAWSCAQNGGLCDFFNTMWPGQSADSILPVSGAVLTIPSDLLTLEQTYRVSIRLSKSGLEGSAANISVLITNPTTPSLLVRCKLGCGVKLNPSELLALEAVCVNCDDSGLSIQTYQWSVTRSSTNLPIDAAKLAVGTTTGIRQSVFVLSANFFEVSDVYDIRVTATNSESEEGATVYTVITNSPPSPGSCSISPQSGQAIVTQFTAMCNNFVDEDLPLLYRMYLQNEAGQNDMLLYYGQESSTSHLTLPAGLESRNYTHNVSILVFDSYDTSTSVTVSVQVLSLQTGSESVSEVLRDMVQNLSVTTSSQAGNQDILRLAENIATSLNDEVGDSAEESKVKRSETREILLTKLSDVEIKSQDSLEQMTNIIGELTTTTVELTDTMQDLAVNVSAHLTESLGDVAETAPTVAKSIAMKQLLILENLIELTVNPGAETTPAPGSGTSIPPTKTKIEEKTKPILDVYEKIGDAMLRGIQFASEEPLHIESKKTSLALAWTKADDDSDMELTAKLQDNGQAGQIKIPIKSSLQKSSTISTDVEAVNVQVQVMSSNPFVWDDSAEGINLPIVNIILKSRGLHGRKLTLEDLLKPADIIITDNTTVSEHAWENHELNVTVDSNSNNIISSDSKAIKIASNSSLMVKLNSVNTSLTLKVLVKINSVLFANEVVDSGFDMPLSPNLLLRSGNLTQAPDLVFLPKMEGNDSYYTVGFTIKPGQSLDTEGLKNGTLVNVRVETYSLTCSYWDEGLEMWSTRGCLVSPFTTLESLHCLCNHLSVFSGGIFVAPNTVNPVTDIVLFLQFFDNPVVVSAVIALWGVYLLVLSWARQKDKDDAKKIGTTVLADNDPSDKYVYLICVVTSWWPQAGTTANIFLYLRARYRQSARHILADPHRKLFTPGAENWFVLTTSRRLGKLKSVVVWHDNKGKNPSWFLKEVVVRDIQTKEVWHCLYDDWLAVDRGPGFIQVEIPSLSQTNMDDHHLYQFMLQSSQDFRNSHLWISIFSKPAYNQFTRAQRLTCGLCLLLTTMLTSIMFHGVPTDAPEDQVQSGQVALSLSGIVIGIQSGLIMFPINTIFLELFTRTAPKEVPSLKSLPGEGNRDATSKTGKDEVCEEDIEISICNTRTESGSRKAKCKDLKCCVSRNSSEVVSDSESTGSNADKPSVKEKRSDKVDFVKADTCGGDSVTVGTDEVDLAMSRARRKSSTTQTVDAKKKVKKSFSFPWWFLYITWTLCLATCIICSFFVMLYGLKYGYQKSVDWLVSFLTAFTQSATVTQPIKVVVLAVLLTQILKRPVNYDSWTPTEEEEVETLREKVASQVKSQVTDHQRYYTPPLSTRVLQEICKRIQLDNKARMILYEILLYFTFVAIVLLMIYGHRDINLVYRVTHTTETMFTEGTGFSEVSTVDSMWKYLQGDFLNNLVSGTDASSPTSCQASYLLGKARLRQLRLNPGTCSYPAIMKKFASVSCTGPYWLSDEETGHYNTSWSKSVATPATTTMYTYQSSFQLVTIPFVGLLATYSGGGYVQELPRLPDSARGVMDIIQSSDWIDQYTRALFVEFNLYNPNVNLLSVVILVFEFTNLGGVFPYYQIFTSKLYHYSGEFEQFVAACEAMFLIYVIIFTYLEIKKYRQMSTSEYFQDTWSYVEIIILALSYTVFGLFIQRIVTVDYSIKLYKESMGQSFVSFYPAASIDIILQYVMAALSIFIILKVFKLLRFNLRMSILAGSLKRCRGILFQFFIKVFLYTMAFACFGLLVFATELQEYSSFGTSLITLFNFALGASDYFGLESASRTLGPAFFFMFSFLFQFLLISIFISIVMDGYASMVEHVLSLHTELHMVEFIWRKIKLRTMKDKKRKNAYQRDLYKIQTRR
ncbi:uncharacterized protein LOC124131324 isoform X2 [Haliotis rufescens]|uniref:uncharacterized protein LOC124131324 isoform X2 n=1 Tax=Haliotis rufescens TaxID=6454 RepID=UPI00201F119C|nr:uncharacterized protein LOC124131324 isoform X2 [Haliotis rufescens]